MKLGFWTLGMPAWSNAETAKHSSELGYQGVDLRCTAPENGKPSALGNICVESSDAEVEETKRVFAQAGMEISSLLCDNRAGLGGPQPDWDVVEADIVTHLRFATRVGTPEVRLAIGRPEPATWESYMQNFFKATQNALKETPGLSVVFASHVGTAPATKLLALADKFADPRIGVELSPDHSVVEQEDPLELIERYSSSIHHLCFADRKPVAEDLGKFDGRYYTVRYEACLPGEGIVPLAKITDRMSKKGYEGYISLKWEKSDRFGLQLPEGDIALAHFVGFMRSLGVQGSPARVPSKA